MMRRFAILVVVAVAALAAAPATPTAEEILAHMSANMQGLNTYQVPVQVSGHVREVISLPITLTGTRYFEAPDREALKFDSVPDAAKAFQNMYNSLGTPATWGKTYDVTSVAPQVVNGQNVYEMRCVYKRQSTVDHILADVDAATFAPIQVRWFYKNGATIVMSIQVKTYGGYSLPSRELLQIHFPHYSANADVDYGTYIINQPIPPGTFQSS